MKRVRAIAVELWFEHNWRVSKKMSAGLWGKRGDVRQWPWRGLYCMHGEELSMERVSHHGRETAYRLSDRGGDGSTLLCVHGSGGAKSVWKAQARMSDEVPVATLDLSGHGASDDVAAEPGYETLTAYTSDVIAVAEEVDADVLVGNSLGGAVALWCVLERNFAPDGLVLAGTGAKLAVLEDLLNWLETDYERALEFLHEPDCFFHDPDPESVDFSEAAMRETGREITRRDFRTCHEFDVRSRLDEIDVPSLALVGEHDKLTPPRYHDFFADEIPDCERATIEDAAHLAMLERPTAFNEALRAFVDRL